jgi:hypothetical protein
VPDTASPSMSQVLGRAAKLVRLLEEGGLSDQDFLLVQDSPMFRNDLVRFWQKGIGAFTMKLTGAQAIEALIGNWFMVQEDDIKGALVADPDGLFHVLRAIEEMISRIFKHDPELMLDPRVINEERAWQIIYNGHALVQAMLDQTEVDFGSAWFYALKYVPSQRIHVADRLMNVNQRWQWIIARMVPERAEVAWGKLWENDARPALRQLQSVAKANPMFRERVAQLILEKYPKGKWSRKSLAWVKRFGTSEQREEAIGILAGLD